MTAAEWFIARRFLFWRMQEIDASFKKFFLWLLASLFASLGLVYGGAYLYLFAGARLTSFSDPGFHPFAVFESVYLAACAGVFLLRFTFQIQRKLWRRLLLLAGLAGVAAGVLVLLGVLGVFPRFNDLQVMGGLTRSSLLVAFQGAYCIAFLILFVAVFLLSSRNLILITNLIAIGGVAVGVAALIIVIGVIDGIDDLLFTNTSRLTPHVRIRGAEGRPIQIDPALLARLNENRAVSIARPVIEKNAILYNDGDPHGSGYLISLLGADEVGPGTLYPDIFNRETGGAINIPRGTIMIGRPVARELGLTIANTARIKSTSPVSEALSPFLPSQPATIMGVYGTRMPEIFDSHVVFMPVENLREFYRMPGGSADYIQVMLKDAFAAGGFKAALGLPPAQYKVTTWIEENGDFFGALKLERLGLWLILMLVIIVAALNIVGTLILMVIEKTRAVGLLRALGASERLVARIFLMDGMTIGLLGTLVGAAIGIAGCLLIPQFNIDLPAAVIYNHLPVKIRLGDITLVIGASLVICTLAGLFPARQAAKLNPVEALRYD